jgi:hypothetical protein
LVEQPIRNRQVSGSTPLVGSILFVAKTNLEKPAHTCGLLKNNLENSAVLIAASIASRTIELSIQKQHSADWIASIESACEAVRIGFVPRFALRAGQLEHRAPGIRATDLGCPVKFAI